MFTPSTYQQAIFNWIQNGKGHAVVDAVPGSGKTTTLVEAAKLLKKNMVAIFVAFNKHIATEIGEKLKEQGSTMQAMTIHSLGLQALRAINPRPQIDGKKYDKICKQYLQDKGEYDYERLMKLTALVKFAQLTLTNAKSEDALREMVNHYSIEIDPEDWKLLWKAVDPIIQAGVKQFQMLGIVDFNDMIWLPIALNLKPGKADFLMVDEAQDLNAAQLELVLRAVNGTGRLIFVGDRRQSLYGFCGADTESINTIIKRTNATVLPLSICYRCPKSHVRLCADIFPGIEASETATEGEIEFLDPEKLYQVVRPGDLVLCRTTAPLVETCLSLLREGVRAKVRGRDIGANFISILNKLQKNSRFVFEMFSQFLDDYRQLQAAAIGISDKDAEMKLAALDDKVDTMYALHKAYLDTLDNPEKGTTAGFTNYIENFFSDELGASVILSTVHKAKGLEEKRVFILKPELMPHPKAKAGWQMEQELNIKYVAYSRSKQSLYFIERLPVEEDEPEATESQICEVTPEISNHTTIVEEVVPVASEELTEPKKETRGRKKRNRQHYDVTLPPALVKMVDQRIIDGKGQGIDLDRGVVIEMLLEKWLNEGAPIYS